MLQPIRDHTRQHHPPEPDDLARAADHYRQIALTLGPKLGWPGGAAAAARLTTEAGNLETILLHELDSDDPVPAVEASIALTAFLRRSGFGSTRILEAALTAAQGIDAVHSQAAILHSLGIVATERFDHGAAADYFQQALPLYEQVGSVLGQAHCFRGLGETAVRRWDLDAAADYFQQAQPLYEQAGSVLGQANCIYSLGDIAQRRSELDAAADYFQQALTLYGRIQEQYSIGQSHRRLARLATSSGERGRHVQAARDAWNGIARADLAHELDEEFGDV